MVLDRSSLTAVLSDMDDVEILARTLYGEARGEVKTCGQQALIAVGNVIMNRVHQGIWYGRTIRGVCLYPYQFSCWNEGDMNLGTLLRVTSDKPVFQECLEVAYAVAHMMVSDVTMGSDHYFSTDMGGSPRWAQYADEKVHIGKHRFYKMRSK